MGMEFWSCDLWPWSYDRDLGNCVDTAVSKLLMTMWPICTCGPPVRHRCAWAWNFGTVIFDLGAMTLTLGILWALLCPSYWCECGQFVPVDYPWGVDVHRHGILALWPSTLKLWPWPWKSCGHCCVQCINANAPMRPICACGLPMRGRCAWAWILVLWPFDLGDRTMT